MKAYHLPKLICLSAAALALCGCGSGPEDPSGAVDAPQEMRDFVIELAEYARQTDPGFIVVPQNGQELLTASLEPDGEPVPEYLGAIDGQGREDLFFGYLGDDEETPEEEKQWILQFLDLAEENGIEVMVTDYCWTPEKVDSSYAWNERRGFVSFAADHRDLDDIPPWPSEPWGMNDDPVENLPQARNFLYLINDQAFSSVGEFVDALDSTEYDVLVIDLFCCGGQMGSLQTAELSTKPGGGDRLVLCYMSIGEAEDYRWYWNPSWTTDPPSWLGPENPEWPGNYLVDYWDPGWKAIIFGSPDSYLDMVIEAGFDGVYLDKIDSFEAFQPAD
jgi:cysteinyl-tRNA synthetase, unknown class